MVVFQLAKKYVCSAFHLLPSLFQMAMVPLLPLLKLVPLLPLLSTILCLSFVVSVQANVYHATKSDGQELAIKIYKTSVLVFK